MASIGGNVPTPPKKLTLKQKKQLQEVFVPPIWYWVIGYALFLIWVNSGFATMARMYGETLVVGVVLLIAYASLQTIKRHRKTFYAVISLLTLVVWLALTESYRSWINVLADTASVAVVATLAVIAWHVWRWVHTSSGPALNRRARYPSTRSLVVVAIVASWCGISLISFLLARQMPLTPARFASLGERSIVPEESQRWSGKRVGLALSGGGYRAAVFHAGTLHALETLGIQVDALSTVSGGSIIGAYYALGGDPVLFRQAVDAGRFNLLQEVFQIQNVLRLLVPFTIVRTESGLAPRWSFTRRDIQAGLLRRTLFRMAASAQPADARQPALMFATTDLSFGLGIGLLDDGILAITPDHESLVYRLARYQPDAAQERFDVADRVAMSGAFPLAFPPQALKVTLVPVDAPAGVREMLLADGGIFDNLGLDLLTAANDCARREGDCSNKPTRDGDAGSTTPEHWRLDAILASDASALFDVESNISGFGALGRAFDVVASKGGVVERRDANLVRLSVKAVASQLGAGTLFDHTSEESANKLNELGERKRFDPRDGYPESVLRAMGSSFSEPTRNRMNDITAAFLKAATDGGALAESAHRRWAKRLPHLETQEDCRKARASGAFAAELQTLPGICEAVAMRALIEQELHDDIAAFRGTATLDSWPEKNLVDGVYRLGQLLVYLSWYDLRCAMDAPPGTETRDERSQRCALRSLLPNVEQ